MLWMLPGPSRRSNLEPANGCSAFRETSRTLMKLWRDLNLARILTSSDGIPSSWVRFLGFEDRVWWKLTRSRSNWRRLICFRWKEMRFGDMGLKEWREFWNGWRIKGISLFNWSRIFRFDWAEKQIQLIILKNKLWRCACKRRKISDLGFFAAQNDQPNRI